MKSTAMMSRVGVGVAIVALLGLLGAVPAGAAEGDSFYTVIDEDPPGAGAIATIDVDGPTFTAFGVILPVGLELVGIDVFGDVGRGIAIDTDSFFVVTWDRITGALIGAPVPISQTIDAFAIFDAATADILPVAVGSLPAGTLISYLATEVAADTYNEYVVSIDPVTGVATELVDITGVTDFFDSLATDPTTGATYAFVDQDDGMPQYLELDLLGGTYTGPTNLANIQATLNGGYMLGADFDSAGFLWFYYFVEGLDATLLAAANDPFSAAVNVDAVGAVSDDISLLNLAIAPAVVEPTLAATGMPVAGVAAGGAAVALAGLAVVFFTRRRIAA